MRKRSEVRRARVEREEKKPEFLIDVPNDPINEQVVLAAEIVDPEIRRKLVKLFPPEAFYAEPHRAIHAAVIELERRGLAFDPATVARVAPDVDVRILETLTASRPEVPPNIDFHVETLKWDWRRAQLTKGPFAALLEAVQDPRETPDRVRALMRQIGEAADEAATSARFLRDPKQVVAEMMSRIRARVDGEAVYPFGVPELDLWEEGATNSKGEDVGGTPRILPGADPGGTTVLTGMSGSGKTTLAGHLIIGLARQRRRVGVGAWEVRAPMTLELLTTLSLGWSRAAILNGKSNRLAGAALAREELVEFEEQAHRISKWVAFIDNPFRRGSVRTEGRVTNDDYLDILEEHVEASGCAVAVYDLFDRVLRDRAPHDEQEALWRMLEMGERLQIHQVVVHQQLIKGDGVRVDMKPSLQGLKGSSAYVDAGSLILAPHLPARWKNVPDDTIEIYGLKQRYAPPFAVECDWDPDTGQMSRARTMAHDSRDGDEGELAVFAPKGKGKKGRR